MDTSLTYENALSELQQIQQDLEHDRIAVDQLSHKIERAYFLLNFCREKLRDAESQITRIVGENPQER